jgi:hypothetical protein
MNNNKIEAMVILCGLSIVILGIAIHLMKAAYESQKLKSLETNSGNIDSRLDDTKSEDSVILSGTLDPSEFNKDVPTMKASRRTKKKENDN